MHINDLQKAFDQAGKRTHLIGSDMAGVLVALDMEGRLFTVWNGEVINRVNTDAIRYHSDQHTYYNPGGDVLWPAPEGTCLGYQYSTDKWRVSPGIRFACYQVKETENRRLVVEAEIDLVNNCGIGIPTLFARDIYLTEVDDGVQVNVRESITYIGKKPLSSSQALIAPWTLCQFDTDYGGKVIFPCGDKSELWDLYDDTIVPQCILHGDTMEIPADGKKRFQVGLAPSVPWIEFHSVQHNLRVKRSASVIPSSQSYIDISDADPQCAPGSRGVRYSVYNDSSNFMEIEAVGGCPEVITPGMVLSVDVETGYRLL
ncbi:hypothetical protein DC498_19965 [Terrimonas sp.]|uniref:DUF6786 family protein n=1 Tax=Terrimonas sp. TaxID=1914338 RepID=UPI000D51C610|nr:DUF6786 family protein [Terrimonas sp.]PVD50397.1 hypothetical protein DC498_19965 [Terrimonas sp.]